MRLKNKEQKVDNINCWGYVICLTLSTGIILLNYWSYHFEKTILTCIMIILINKKNCFFTFIRVVIEILCHDHIDISFTSKPFLFKVTALCFVFIQWRCQCS